MNHNIDSKINNNNNNKNREDALLVLPVAFDNQGGLASTEQRGELPLCAVGSVQELMCSSEFLSLKQNLRWMLTRRVSLIG